MLLDVLLLHDELMMFLQLIYIYIYTWNCVEIIKFIKTGEARRY